MSPRRRIASLSVASAVAIGLIVAIGVAPPVTADPCEGAAADAQPSPDQAFRLPNPGTHAFGPIGHRPAGANASAPTALPLTGLQRSWGVTVDSKGNLYVADSINDRVLKLPVQ